MRTGPDSAPGAAVVFDFDGTIVDTETVVYQAWKHTFESAGAVAIPLDTWLQYIGLADADALDPRALLCEQLGLSAWPVELDATRREFRDSLLAAEPIRPGVLDWIDQAEARGLRLAVASSSPTEWVVPHLTSLGLYDRFGYISCADPGTPGKPDPTVYRHACAWLDVPPSRSIAVEDSAAGTAAAIAAGMRCVAVPGPMTAGMDFGHAHVRAGSLADVDLETQLAQLG